MQPTDFLHGQSGQEIAVGNLHSSEINQFRAHGTSLSADELRFWFCNRTAISRPAIHLFMNQSVASPPTNAHVSSRVYRTYTERHSVYTVKIEWIQDL